MVFWLALQKQHRTMDKDNFDVRNLKKMFPPKRPDSIEVQEETCVVVVQDKDMSTSPWKNTHTLTLVFS